MILAQQKLGSLNRLLNSRSRRFVFSSLCQSFSPFLLPSGSDWKSLLSITSLTSYDCDVCPWLL